MSAASRRSSSAGWTPRSTDVWRRSAPTRRSRCAAEPRSRKPSSPTSSSTRPITGARWERLADRGARVQRPLWASTSTKNPDYPDTLYVDEPHRARHRQHAAREHPAAFEDHGRLARTIDVGRRGSRARHARARHGRHRHGRRRATLEEQGMAELPGSFAHVLGTLSQVDATQPVTGPRAAEADAGLGRLGAVRAARHRGPHRVMIAAQLTGLTRLDLPLILGTVVTRPRPGPGRGVLHPPGIGQGSRSATPPRSRSSARRPGGSAALLGLLHVAVALTVLVPLLPGVHPRMASHRAGPTRPRYSNPRDCSA